MKIGGGRLVSERWGIVMERWYDRKLAEREIYETSLF